MFRRLKGPRRRWAGSPTSDGNAADSPVSTARDIAFAYRLILGRAPESALVVEEKVGMPRLDMLRAFVSSEEFSSHTRPFLARRQAGELFRDTGISDLRDWARAVLLPAEDKRDLSEFQDPAPLLAHCLGFPALADLVDEALGAGSAVAIREDAVHVAWPRLKAFATRQDLLNCYLLFLRRPPESEEVIQARPHQPLAETICDFLDSAEFASRIALPAIDGRLEPAQCRVELADWVREELQVDESDLDAARLLAGALEQPAIARVLASRKLSWRVSEVVRAMTGDNEIADPAHCGPVDLLGEVATNMEVVATHQIQMAAGSRKVEFTGGDPWIRLVPTDAARGSDLIAVRFRVTLGDLPAVGRLYLNYGGGISEDSALTIGPDRNGFNRAVVAAPRRLVELRWDPSAMPGVANISMIEAVSITTDAYLKEEFGSLDEAGGAALLARFALEANQQPDTPVAVAMSRVLSPSVGSTYPNWILRNELHGAAGAAERQKRYAALTARPLISILVPVYDPPAYALSAMLASVREQVYEDWELCIANDCSTKPDVREILDRAASEDRRIKVVHRTENGHICRASNSALEMATGSWIAFLDHDDTLSSEALLAIAEYLNANPRSGMVYSDEDKLDERGQRTDPYFKPDYSPELLLAQNYINHLTAIRADLVREAGGFRVGFEGSQDHDLILRVAERLRVDQIGHIPQILYHWRAIAGSTARENSEKDYVLTAGQAAVRDHLARTGRDGDVTVMDDVHHYRVRLKVPEAYPLVSLVIPTRDKVDVLRTAVESILERSTYDNYEIIIVDNDSVESETREFFAVLQDDVRVRVLPYHHPFNYSKINNFAVKHARGSVIGLVNNDVEVISSDWMEEMVSWAMQKEIGCVGAKLYYSDMSIQHAGVIIGLGGCAGHSHKYFAHDASGYFNRLKVHQNMSAVTAACLFVRREIYDEVGGLEEKLSVAFNDVDFCLRVREAGYRNLFTPFAELFHHESVSRGYEDTPEKIARAAQEVSFMKDRWKEKLKSDPFYSPHLPYDREDFGMTSVFLE